MNWKLDIATIQYVLAPVTAPVPSAIAVGATLAHALSLIPGIDPNLALAGGIGGGIATEVSGGLMFSMAAKSFFQRQWGAFGVALLGSAVYIGVVAYSVFVSQDATPIAAAVIVSGLVYVAVALYQFLRDRDKQAVDTREQAEKARLQAEADAQKALETKLLLLDKEVEIEQRRAEIEKLRLDAEAERLRQEKLLEAQRARAAKYAGQGQSVQSVQRRTTVHALRPEWLQKTRDYLAAHPSATTRDISALLGAGSPSTGKAYRDAVLGSPKSPTNQEGTL